MSDYLNRFYNQKAEDDRAMGRRPANSVNQSLVIPPTEDAVARIAPRREPLSGPTSFRPAPEVQSYVDSMNERQGIGQVQSPPQRGGDSPYGMLRPQQAVEARQRAGAAAVQPNTYSDMLGIDEPETGQQAIERVLNDAPRGTLARASQFASDTGRGVADFVGNAGRGIADFTGTVAEGAGRAVEDPANFLRGTPILGTGISRAVANRIEGKPWLGEVNRPEGGSFVAPVTDPVTGVTRYMAGEDADALRTNIEAVVSQPRPAAVLDLGQAPAGVETVRGASVGAGYDLPRNRQYRPEQIAQFDNYKGYDLTGLDQNKRMAVAEELFQRDMAARELQSAQRSGMPMPGQVDPSQRAAVAQGAIDSYNLTIASALDPKTREDAEIARQLALMDATEKYGAGAASSIYNQEAPELGGMAAVRLAREGRIDEDYLKRKEEDALNKLNSRDATLVQYAADMGIPRLSLGQQRELMEALGEGPIDKNEAQRLIAVQQLLSQGNRRGFFNDDDPRGSLAEVTPYQAKPWELLTPRRLFPWAGHAALGLKGPEGQPYYIRDPTEEQRDLMEFAFGKKAEWPLD